MNESEQDFGFDVRSVLAFMNRSEEFSRPSSKPKQRKARKKSSLCENSDVDQEISDSAEAAID